MFGSISFTTALSRSNSPLQAFAIDSQCLEACRGEVVALGEVDGVQEAIVCENDLQDIVCHDFTTCQVQDPQGLAVFR